MKLEWVLKLLLSLRIHLSFLSSASRDVGLNPWKAGLVFTLFWVSQPVYNSFVYLS